jgi:nucleotide-binding universal stress UspA family protein
MYETILVPPDSSKRAEVILPHVERLAQAFFGSVAAGLLHRIDRPLLVIRARKSE